MDLATGGKGGIGVFVGLCIISAAFGVADAHVQGGMVGDLSLMCPEFIQVCSDLDISGWLAGWLAIVFIIIILQNSLSHGSVVLGRLGSFWGDHVCA